MKNENENENYHTIFQFSPVYLMVIGRLLFISFKVYIGEISKILLKLLFSDIKLSHLETILLNAL